MTHHAMSAVPGIHQAAGLRGFAAEFRDLDHYIRVITDRIWEGRRIDDIHAYYSDPCIVETPMSVSTAVADVISGTRATLAMFPDRRLLAEDVIQSGDDRGGFLSSHRIISPMTHLGDGSFGRATGARVHARTIADCVCKDNRIIHEWLVRDQAAIALQIGTTPRALAQQWLDQRGGWNKPVAGPAPAGYVSHVSAEPMAQKHAQGLEALLRRNGDAAALYDDAAHLIGPGERSCYGHAEIADFWQGLASSFRVTQFAVEHLVLQRDMASSGRPDRIALRFRAQTVHEPLTLEAQRFGKGTGRPVEMLGIVHAELFRGRVLRQWVLLDEVALWMQILAPAT